jgi:hypothetical protein
MQHSRVSMTETVEPHPPGGVEIASGFSAIWFPMFSVGSPTPAFSAVLDEARMPARFRTGEIPEASTPADEPREVTEL